MSNTHPTSEALGTLFRTTQADLDAKGFKEYIQDYTKITTLTDLFDIPKGSRIRYKIKTGSRSGARGAGAHKGAPQIYFLSILYNARKENRRSPQENSLPQKTRPPPPSTQNATSSHHHRHRQQGPPEKRYPPRNSHPQKTTPVPQSIRRQTPKENHRRGNPPRCLRRRRCYSAS